jgi:hypothetical protein
MSKINNPISINPEKLSGSNCDGLGWSNIATEKITLKAGKFGRIEVSVCSKFKNIIKRKEELFSENESLVHPFSQNPTEVQHRHYIQSTGDSMYV